MAKLSRNVPPLDAVATTVPAAGGPCRTVSHSCSVKSLLPVIARSSASGGLANLDQSFVRVANITANFGGALVGPRQGVGPPSSSSRRRSFDVGRADVELGLRSGS